jgi:tryptophanase
VEYPGEALTVALYGAGRVHSVEIGTVMFGRHPDGSEVPAALDLVRQAIRGGPTPSVTPTPSSRSPRTSHDTRLT